MIDWITTAFVFPGQGAQEVGMGADIVSEFPAAAAVFQQADEILGFSLSKMCFNGPEEALNDTLNTQPALYVMGIAILRAIQDALGGNARPAFVAGHSLGELTALTAAGALDFEAGVQLVRERGRLMKAAGQHTPGAMAALLGLDANTVHALCAEVGTRTNETLVLANDNCPGQIVISGTQTAIDAAVALAPERGAKRAVPLVVSIASHSPLMQSIAPDFQQAIDATTFDTPVIPIIGNVSALPLANAADIRAELGAQLTSTVRWTESVQHMLEQGITTFVEIGPKDVLSGLIKRIDRNTQRSTLNSVANVSAFLNNAI